jgi:predicted dehydrogenase
MSKIRLGFVGVGNMGQCAHLRNYATLKDVEITAIAEIRPKLREQVARTYGALRTYADHKAMLAAEKLDGIVAIQPFVIHGGLLPELFSAGVPVIIEKPLARAVEAGRKILSALEKSKASLYVGFHKRSDPATEYGKQVIDEWKRTGEMGKMRMVRMSMPPGDWTAAGFSHRIDTDEAYPGVTLDPSSPDMDEATANEYDAFVNYYIHQVDLMYHLFGEPYKVSHVDPSGVVLVTNSASGVAGTLEMDAYRSSVDWQEEAFVAFQKGWVRIELPAPMAIDRPGRVTIFRDTGEGALPTTITPTLPLVHAMRQQAINFTKAIKGEKTGLCRAADALQHLEVARDVITMTQSTRPKKAAACQ